MLQVLGEALRFTWLLLLLTLLLYCGRLLVFGIQVTVLDFSNCIEDTVPANAAAATAAAASPVAEGAAGARGVVPVSAGADDGLHSCSVRTFNGPEDFVRSLSSSFFFHRG